MSNKNETFNPILPYDITKGEHFIIYDNVTYYRNLNLLSNFEATLETGNIVKYYRCGLKESKKVGGDPVLELDEKIVT